MARTKVSGVVVTISADEVVLNNSLHQICVGGTWLPLTVRLLYDTATALAGVQPGTSVSLICSRTGAERWDIPHRLPTGNPTDMRLWAESEVEIGP